MCEWWQPLGGSGNQLLPDHNLIENLFAVNIAVLLQMLMQYIKKTSGVKLMANLLVETLMRSHRVVLRFGDSVKSVGTYCALLLHQREYFRCQQVMSLMKELSDDHKQLQDMRNIFNMYDEDGSGELDEDEFVEVLKQTGFEEQEARSIFLKINTDGEGGISMEEWEEWWLDAQRSEKLRSKGPANMTGSGLLSSLEKLTGVAIRLELHDLAEDLEKHLSTLRTGNALPANQVLKAQPLKGNMKGFVDELVWKLYRDDLEPAVRQVYDVLMRNCDRLDYNPLLIPPPGSDVMMATNCEVAQLYLELLATLLAPQDGMRQAAEQFAKYARNLASSCWGRASHLHGTSQQPHNAIGARGVKIAKTDVQKRNEFQQFQVVKGMVALKYGSGVPLGKAAIVEASTSLSTWQAKNKAVTKSYNAGVSDLSSQYLSAGMGARCNPRKHEGSMLDFGMRLVNTAKVERVKHKSRVRMAQADTAASKQDEATAPADAREQAWIQPEGMGKSFVAERSQNSMSEGRGPSEGDSEEDTDKGFAVGDAPEKQGSAGDRCIAVVSSLDTLTGSPACMELRSHTAPGSRLSMSSSPLSTSWSSPVGAPSLRFAAQGDGRCSPPGHVSQSGRPGDSPGNSPRFRSMMGQRSMLITPFSTPGNGIKNDNHADQGARRLQTIKLFLRNRMQVESPPLAMTATRCSRRPPSRCQSSVGAIRVGLAPTRDSSRPRTSNLPQDLQKRSLGLSRLPSIKRLEQHSVVDELFAKMIRCDSAPQASETQHKRVQPHHEPFKTTLEGLLGSDAGKKKLECRKSSELLPARSVIA